MTKTRGMRTDRSATSNRLHDVVIVKSTTSAIEAVTRATITAAAIAPCSVTPRLWPNSVPSGTMTSPGVTTFNVAGSTTTAVKSGTNSTTRRTNIATGRPDAHAMSTVATDTATSTTG